MVKRLVLFVIIMLCLSACIGNSGQKVGEKPAKETKITIEPMKLTEKEQQMISQTGVEFIEYFKLNGGLKKDDDLVFAVDMYKKGEKEEVLSSDHVFQHRYKDEITSFGVSVSSNSDSNSEIMTILLGLPGGLTSSSIDSKMMGSTYGRNLAKKIQLKKNKPVFLAYWKGTTEDYITGPDKNDDGKFPARLKDSDLAIVYKVTLVDRTE
ncbi:hypothetical protein J2S13_002292 [Oikeobacillus pervagus]|uniref:Lipoprotein n=1 Tax=Oikeobacillus pervagus TaxID=1325931 RepID=A0AAJ1T315_9BACI|nr:hypothetical protein [Oikeobacillus pervagus]MDQ0215872.1 hypothetical protein [Oikeobacillus pervagus]